MQAVVAIAPTGELLRTTFRHEDLVQPFLKRVRRALPELTLHVVHGDTQEKPQKGVEAPNRHHLWCPYCYAWRRFKPPAPGWYSRCEVCRISDEDFWVKRANHLWALEDEDKWYAREEVAPELEEKREKRRLRAMKRRAKKAGKEPENLLRMDKAERRKERKKRREEARKAATIA